MKKFIYFVFNGMNRNWIWIINVGRIMEVDYHLGDGQSGMHFARMQELFAGHLFVEQASVHLPA